MSGGAGGPGRSAGAGAGKRKGNSTTESDSSSGGAEGKGAHRLRRRRDAGKSSGSADWLESDVEDLSVASDAGTSEDSDFQEASASNGKPAGPRPRRARANKSARVQGSRDQWHAVDECTQVSEDQVTAMLHQTSKAELGGSAKWSPAIWKPAVPSFNKLGLRRIIYRCPFRGHANSNCTALLRVTVNREHEWTLERSVAPHADHNISHRQKGLSKKLVSIATSPSKEGLAPRKVARKVMKEHGALSVSEQRQLREVLKNASKRHRDDVLPSASRGTFGGLNEWVNRNSRAALQAEGAFGPHSTFVCGTPQIIPEKQCINLAYSTENLLLNAYRQQQHGFPSILHVDCTHRLVVEGHACMLFGTVDAAQKFHIIGYGICNKEDDTAHQHVFRCLKAEVESIVAQRIRDQQGI